MIQQSSTNKKYCVDNWQTWSRSFLVNESTVAGSDKISGIATLHQKSNNQNLVDNKLKVEFKKLQYTVTKCNIIGDVIQSKKKK